MYLRVDIKIDEFQEELCTIQFIKRLYLEASSSRIHC